ncbi:MAG TPA: hypothetical protein VN867_05220 [Candidatus Binataceae bacterium]|nr:hypothetical protein [Candidatus Binataceae bacterium]
MHTLIGLIMVVLTAVGFYLIARNRYKCPYCARTVKWTDVNCPHCGEDMKFLHRTGPPKPPRRVTHLKSPTISPPRSRRNRG